MFPFQFTLFGSFAAFWQGNPLLLLLDNLEHLLYEIDFIRDLLQETARVTLLVTSRERLPLQAAYTFLLSGLPVPPAATRDVTKALTYSSVRLFAERAARQPLAPPLSEDSLPEITALCRLVQGLPLALELAAAWAGYLSYTELRQAISNGIDALSVDLVDVPKRQRDIHATFESSWYLLSPVMQYHLSRLVVFRGGFNREAALFVADTAISDLNALVDKSLLRRAENGRYDGHPLVQQFMSEKLWLSPFMDSIGHARFAEKTPQMALMPADRLDTWDSICQSCRALIFPKQPVCAHEVSAHTRIDMCWTVTHQRHARYYLTFVADSELALIGWRPHETIAHLQTDWDNIQQALYWSAARGQLQLIENCLAGLSEYFVLNGLTEAGLFVLRTVENIVLANKPEPEPNPRARRLFFIHLHLQIARFLIVQGKSNQAMSIVSTILEDADIHTLPGAILAAANWYRGKCLQHQGDYRQAQNVLELALNTAQQAQTMHIEAQIWVDLGVVFAEHSNFGQAQRCFQRAEEIAREMGHCRLVCAALSNSSTLAMNLANYRQAEELAQQVVSLSREIAFPVGEVRGLYSLVTICRQRGSLTKARQFAEEAQARMANLDRPFEQTLINHELSLVNDATGLHYEALSQMNSILDDYRQMNRPWQLINALNDTALILSHMGDYMLAREYCADAEKLAQEIDALEQIYVDAAAAYILIGLEQYDATIEFCRQAQDVSLVAGNRHGQACALTYLGHALSHLSQWGQSEAAYRQVITLRQQTGQNQRVLEAQAGLAWVLSQQGDMVQAQTLANVVWASLQGDNTDGVQDLPHIYLVCYRLFQRLDKPVVAGRVLQQAHRLVQERAAHIADERLRRLYLQNVPANRHLLAESRRYLARESNNRASKTWWTDARH